MLKKWNCFLIAFAMVFGLFSVENALAAGEVLDKDGKLITYYASNVFYADKEKSKVLFYHPGNEVGTEKNITDENRAYTLLGGRIHPKSSRDRFESIGSLIPTAWKKGYTLEGKIYEGPAQARDKEEVRLDDGTVKLESYNVTKGGSSIDQIPVLFTIKDNGFYKGDSTDAKDLLATFTPNEFSDSRLLFIAVEFLMK